MKMWITTCFEFLINHIQKYQRILHAQKIYNLRIVTPRMSDMKRCQESPFNIGIIHFEDL